MIKIIIADDHAMLRQGLRTLLEVNLKASIVEATNSEEAYAFFEKFHPDILILDLDMPGVGGLSTLKRIIHNNVSAKVLIFSMHDDCIYAMRALQEGARGYVTKTESPEVIIDAIQKILKGGRYINNELAQNLSIQSIEEVDNPLKKLSPREFEVFRRIAEGGSLSSISNAMHISYKTVANIQTSVRQKLGAETTGQLVRIAMRNGIVRDIDTQNP